MKKSDAEIQRLLLEDRDAAAPAAEQRLTEAAMAARKAFCANEARGELTRMEFLWRQCRYIRKRWWALQAAVLLGLWVLLALAGTDYAVRRSMGAAAPLFAVLILPELGRSRRAGTAETECTARYSLRQVYAARLTLYAMADLSLLGLFTAAAHTAALPIQEFAVQFFLPFNVTCGICFWTMYGRRPQTELLAGLLCMFWAAAWLALATQEKVYDAVAGPIWYLLSALSALFLICGIYRGQKTCDEMWEEEMLWN